MSNRYEPINEALEAEVVAGFQKHHGNERAGDIEDVLPDIYWTLSQDQALRDKFNRLIDMVE